MGELTDLRLRDAAWILRKIFKEADSQIIKWGIQTHSSFEWLTYTAEELGSLAKAIGEYEYRSGTKEKIVSEAIQVATLALKIAEMFENIKPVDINAIAEEMGHECPLDNQISNDYRTSHLQGKWPGKSLGD